MMAGLFTYSAAGVGFLLIAAIEAAAPKLHRHSHLSLRYLSVALLSSLSILDAFFSSLNPASHHDPIGAPLPLSTLAAASLFLLYSLAGLLSLYALLPLPASLLDLLLLSAFTQELLLLLLRRKDTDSLENRYWDLLLLPALAAAVATLAAIARPRSNGPRLARAAALGLHGSWLVQIAFCLFSSALRTHGCDLHRRSRANFTIRCRSHSDYHRARGIATLQFDLHLALLVIGGVVVFSLLAGKTSGRVGGYRPLNKDLQMMDLSSANFTLDSDDDVEEVVPEANGVNGHQREVVLPVSETNGRSGSH